jgi:gluconolactonase
MRTNTLILLFSIAAGTCSLACKNKEKVESIHGEFPLTGQIERLHPDLDMVIKKDAVIEIIGEGFNWSEGPVWIPEQNMLLFSDVPENKIFAWTEKEGISSWLEPSGYTGDTPRSGEPGSNGLLLDAKGLILCQHGDRRIARLATSLKNPEPIFITLADNYGGRKFNSPNDLCASKLGRIYFTDPPYGLVEGIADPGKELGFQGVYMIDENGETLLLHDTLSRPNGIALSPDEKTLYIANSDPERAIWLACDLDEKGAITRSSIFYDATNLVEKEKGLPDGLKVNQQGNIFATGPGGVWIFNRKGTVLGKIKTGQATANCSFNTDESILYITADMYLLRVILK